MADAVKQFIDKGMAAMSYYEVARLLRVEIAPPQSEVLVDIAE
jgi:hypothetical protein